MALTLVDLMMIRFVMDNPMLQTKYPIPRPCQLLSIHVKQRRSPSRTIICMRSDCIVRAGEGALAQGQSSLTNLRRLQCMKLLMSNKLNATEAQKHQTFVTHRLHSCLASLTCIHDEHVDHPRPQRIIQGDKKARNKAYGC